MGLCKCPKKNVTNQFCFEHRVNVCEYCMVVSHPKCIVQSYIDWLKDSDYNASCGLCQRSLVASDCVRLICYHVFHWECLNDQQAALPNNTAPGGRVCPSCSSHIFPPSNLVSPVADVLRNRLREVTWGQDEFTLNLPAHSNPIESNAAKSTSAAYKENIPENVLKKNNSTNASSITTHNNSNKSINNFPKDHSILSIDSTSNFFQASGSRKPLLQREAPIGIDRDDNKYKRRTPAEMFSRWSRRFYVPSSRPFWRRTWFAVASGIAIFIILMYTMASIGRRGYDEESRPDDAFAHQ